MNHIPEGYFSLHILKEPKNNEKGAIILSQVDAIVDEFPWVKDKFYIVERRAWRGLNESRYAHIKLVEDLSLWEETLEKFPEVRYAGDPVLRQSALEVTVEEGIQLGILLGEVLLRYREAVGYGRGFAAPQIGENKAVFVTFVENKLQTFINPKIVEKSKETNFYKELCLSSGIMSADVERSVWIVMEWTDT